MGRYRALLVTALPFAFAWVGLGGPARATFPGVNGKMVVEANRDASREVYVMDADGRQLGMPGQGQGQRRI